MQAVGHEQDGNQVVAEKADHQTCEEAAGTETVEEVAACHITDVQEQHMEVRANTLHQTNPLPFSLLWIRSLQHPILCLHIAH